MTTHSNLSEREFLCPGHHIQNSGKPDDNHWFVIYTRSRFEKKVHRALQKAKIRSYLPLIKEKRKWSDRLKTVEAPLFPSYVFVNTLPPQFSQIYLIPGFVRFVSFDGNACRIPAKEIVLINLIITQGFQVEKASCCNVGDWVRIIRGPLQGWEGRVDQKKGDSRIVFQFDCIHQGLSVEVNSGDIERVD